MEKRSDIKRELKAKYANPSSPTAYFTRQQVIAQQVRFLRFLPLPSHAELVRQAEQRLQRTHWRYIGAITQRGMASFLRHNYVEGYRELLTTLSKWKMDEYKPWLKLYVTCKVMLIAGIDADACLLAWGETDPTIQDPYRTACEKLGVEP